MRFPDSDWLERIDKAPYGVLIGITLAAFLGIGATIKVGGAGTATVVFLAIAAASGFIVLWKAGRDGLQALHRWRTDRVKQPFKALSERQREFLLAIARRGSRYFNVPDSTTEERWFEELSLWGYVRYQQRMVIVIGDDTTPYRITEKGWRIIERWRASRSA